MIGHVDFVRPGPDGEIAYRATLRDSWRWTIEPDEPTFLALKGMLGDIAEDYRGPSEGPFGPRQLREAAELVGGTFHVEPKDPPPDDVAF